MAIKSIQIQKAISLLGFVMLFACSPQDTRIDDVDNQENVKEDGNANNGDNTGETPIKRSKETILAYFDALIENKQVIVGQHCGDGPDQTTDFYNTYVDVLADKTGRHVGIIGADLGFFPSSDYPVQTLIDHWKAGGLVTVSWHADNPFLAGYDVYWNTVENKDKIHLKTLLKDADENQARTSYRTELDTMAGALQKLRDAGVMVIWRPFHEMNGDFFWWGINAYNNEQTNETDYVALWRDLYNTLTFDYGLDNLIWTYSVIPHKTWNADVTAFYPGSDYVDLVGMDYYGTTPDFPGYNALKSLGKTIVMSEAGPSDNSYGQWNEEQLVNAIRGKAAYFLQWHSWSGAAVAIKDNQNALEMMNSEHAITIDELFPDQ